MTDLSLLAIMLLCFFGAGMVHQISRAILGVSADAYLATVVIAGYTCVVSLHAEQDTR